MDYGENEKLTFPDANLFQDLSVECTVQFIGAAIFHAEKGQGEEVRQQLSIFPDKVLSRNIALYLCGATNDDAYTILIDNLQIEPGIVEMSEVAKEAFYTHFETKPPKINNDIPGELHRESAQSVSDFEEKLQEVRMDVWSSLSNIRNTLQSSSGVELKETKRAYDVELSISVKKLADVSDFESARDLSTGALTVDGRSAAAAEYDECVRIAFLRASSPKEILSLQSLINTTFTPYGGYSCGLEYDNRVLSVMNTLTGPENLETARSLANSCQGSYGISEAKRRHDRLVLQCISQMLETGDISSVINLSRLLLTPDAKEMVRASI